jgi:GH25 family lysozyme M1 (1,4-beta-N-acetylmuramidase)
MNVRIRRLFDTIKTADVENIRAILEYVSQIGQRPTIYSNICNSKNNNISTISMVSKKQ